MFPVRLTAWRLCILAILASAAAQGADQWLRLTTPHFELITSAGEKKGREAILYFEEVRAFFLAVSPSKKASDFPVRIIAFKGEKQYSPYRVNEFAFAYYTGGHDRDYIVMQDILAEHFPTAIHEYTHLVIRHSGLKIPPWMNEGWAELYSTLKPMGKKAMVGDLIPGRVRTIQEGHWIPLETLGQVDHNSPLYNERDRAGLFYAESWVLMHMLYLSPKYRPHFGDFVKAIHSGQSLPEASEHALGQSVKELQTEMHAYLSSSRLFGASFDVKLEKSAEEPEVAEISDFEADLAKAGILIVINKQAEAKQALERLSKENPGNAEVEEQLGYLAWQRGGSDEARAHFAKAFAAGDKNPQMCYHYGSLADSAGDNQHAVEALRRAVELKPDLVDARLRLGLAMFKTQKYDGAIAALTRVKSVNPEQAEWYFGVLAFSYMRTGDRENARKNAEFAKKWAKTPAATQQADDLLRYLDASAKNPKQNEVAEASAPVAQFQAHEESTDEAPPRLTRNSQTSTGKFEEYVAPGLASAEGKAQELVCKGKTAIFKIMTQSGPMAFDIPDPGAVVLKNSSQATRDFTCGAQNGYRVVVEYTKAAAPGAIAGVVKTLEF